MSPFEPGTRLGRYVLVRPIASGGMATVWAARLMGTRGFQKLVAVKIMHPALHTDPEAERMFLAEAKVASRIRHQNVAEVIDLGEENGALYLVMEWVHGATLASVLTAAQKGKPMPLTVAVRIGRHVAAGLHAAHTLVDDAGNPIDLVHRDVSPQNVLVGFNGVSKVVDFGVAKITADIAAETAFGQVKGKVPYMAPEQLRAEPLDRRVDVFATGVLLYMMTTGAHPFRRSSGTPETVRAILSDDPPAAPSRIVPGYPGRLEAVVLRALHKNREDRYSTAEEMEAELARVFPPSVRDGETVRDYVQALLPDAYHAGIALAQAAVDGVAPMVASSSFSALQAAKPVSSGTLRAVAVTSPVAAIGSEAPTLVPPEPTGEGSARSAVFAAPGRRHAAAAAIALASALVTGGVVWNLIPDRSEGQGAAVTSPVPATSAEALPAAPEPLPPAPDSAPAASSSASPSSDDPSARAQRPRVRAAKTPAPEPPVRSAPEPPAQAAPVAPPQPTPGSDLRRVPPKKLRDVDLKDPYR